MVCHHRVFLLKHPLDLVLVRGLVSVEVIDSSFWLLDDTDRLLINMSRWVVTIMDHASILASVLGLLLPVEFELSLVVITTFFTVMHGVVTRYTVMV